MTSSLTVTVDVDKLGVVSKHQAKMATDQTYRNRALTPPGGNAPGSGGKPANTKSNNLPAIPGVVATGTATNPDPK
jgi:hypothetical protein